MISFSNVIDLDSDPVIPVHSHMSYGKRSVLRHRPMASMAWDPEKIQLYCVPRRQIAYNFISGHHLWKELVYKFVFNANLLDYLFAHQELIPEDWKRYEVFFWGTIYKRSCPYCNSPSCQSFLEVRCLLWRNEQWMCGSRIFNDYWSDTMPAALLNF